MPQEYPQITAVITTSYLTLCPFARASPLPRVPRTPPRAAPPRAACPAPPRFDDPANREAGAGVENLGVALEDAGGLSTKDVSVVLIQYIVSMASGE